MSADILIASASEGNVEVMGEFLTGHGYAVKTATSIGEFDTVLESTAFSAAMIDADGFGKDIWLRCETLHEDGVPFFVVSKHAEAANKQGREQGAIGIFEKPISQDALLSTVQDLTHP